MEGRGRGGLRCRVVRLSLVVDLGNELGQAFNVTVKEEGKVLRGRVIGLELGGVSQLVLKVNSVFNIGSLNQGVSGDGLFGVGKAVIIVGSNVDDRWSPCKRRIKAREVTMDELVHDK